jgi:MFS family permease
VTPGYDEVRPNGEEVLSVSTAHPGSPRAPAPTSIRSLLRNVEFRVLTVTQFFSLAGDQLARVALSVLVFDRTNSALQAAITYALTFIPAAIGGPLLNGLADRRPRRSVMIASDLARAPLIGIIAIPSLPLPVALAVLAIAGLFEAPFDAARSALLPDILHGDRYTAGLASFQITIQVAQVGGFGIAGVLLLAWSPSVLLLIDAGSFLASAILIARLISYRPAAHVARTDRHTAWWKYAIPDVRTALDVVLGAPRVRSLAILAWSASLFTIGFEALGAPLARASGAGHWTVGMLLAAQPLGTVVGAIFVVRVRKDSRDRAINLLALLCVVPLIGGLLRPPLWILIVLGLLSGVGMSFSVLASSAFVQRIAPESRGRALGLVGSGLLVGQGVGVLLAGAIATGSDARTAVGILGVAGTGAVLIALWDRSQSATKASQNVEPAPI